MAGGFRAIIARRDVQIISLALLTVGLLSLFTGTFARGKAGQLVRVYVDNQLYAQGELGQDQRIQIGQNGCQNTVVIRSQSVWMEQSSCPHQDCVRQGPMDSEHYRDRPLQNWIICLPNRVSVELAGQP